MMARDLLYEMLRIRRIEEEIARRYAEKKMRCPVHLSIGQEAPAVGVCAALNNNDFMVSTHRAHAHYLAKGGSLKGLICELYGKKDGCSGGHGGSMHLVDWSVGFAGSTSIVGGTIPVGVGLAFSKKMKGEDGIVVVCIGDAAIEEGVFHESANFASLHRLKVLFLVENNHYSCYTNIIYRQPRRSIVHMANGHGLRSVSLSTPDPTIISEETKRIVDLMHRVPSATLLEIETRRFLEHCGPNNDDHLGYRSLADTDSWRDRDPLLNHKNRDLDIADVDQEIEDAFVFAENSPFPNNLGKITYA